MSSKLEEALVNAIHPDPKLRLPAEQQLLQFEKQNFPAYLQALCTAMQKPKIPMGARMLAGLALKNCLTGKTEQRQLELEKRWLLLPQNVQSQIKMRMLHCLNLAEHKIRQTAAQVVANVAKIEIPRRMWGGLIPQLVNAIREQKTSAHLKQACLVTLGYVCDECPDKLSAYSSNILNAISVGMTKNQTNPTIKLAATRALAAALQMAKSNFAIKKQRDTVMEMIFSAVQSPDARVREASFECLAEVARSYYQYIKEYVQKCYMATAQAISKDSENIAKQAIEFWSCVCEEEIDIQIEIEDKGSAERKNHGFMKKAAKELIPLLLRGLTKQSEDPDDEEWNVAQASAACIMLIAQNIRNDILPLIVPTVEKHVSSQNWRLREAAIIAFACVLSGPDKSQVLVLVRKAIKVVLERMKDKVPQVKDSAAWCVGKICEEVPEAISPEVLPVLMRCLIEGLSENSKIAIHACWAIHNLADEVKVVNGTSALSKYFAALVKKLLETAYRGGETLQAQAFESLNWLIYKAAPDCYKLIAELVPELLKRLAASIKQMTNPNALDRARLSNIQAQLCGGINYAIIKTPEESQKYMTNLMEMLVSILRTPKSETHEEALVCIGAVARCTGEKFWTYMRVLQPYIMKSLKDTYSASICGIATGLVGEIARGIEIKIAPFCNDIMRELMLNLQNPDLDRSVKPRILNCLGDIALAIGGNFEKYLPWVMRVLENASKVDFKDSRENDYDVDYLNELRESILEANISILQGLADDAKENLFFRYLDPLVNFLHRIATDTDVYPLVTRSCCSIIGDLARILGKRHGQVREYLLSNAAVKQIIHNGLKSEEAQKQAEMAKAELEALM